MFIKFFRNLTNSGNKEENNETDPLPISTEEEFLEFINQPLENDLSEEYLSIFLKNHRFYLKKIATRSAQQQFQEKLNQIIKQIKQYYIGDNKKNSSELKDNQYLYAFLQQVSQSTIKEIQNQFISSYTNPIQSQISNLTHLFSEKQQKEAFPTYKRDERINLLDPSFNDFDNFENKKTFQLCKMYKNFYSLGMEAANESNLIFPDDTDSNLFKKLTDIVCGATKNFINSLNDPISLLCIDSFVFRLFQESNNTNKHMPIIMKVISTLVQARTLQIISSIGINKKISASLPDYEKMILSQVFPVSLTITEILENQPDLDLNNEKERMDDIFKSYCTDIYPKYDDQTFALSLNNTYKLLETTHWSEYIKIAIIDRSNQICKKYIFKYMPSLYKVLFNDNNEENFIIDDKLKSKAIYETVSLFQTVSKTCVFATQALFSIVDTNRAITEASVITIDTLCGYLEKLYLLIPEISTILGTYDHASDSLRKIATSP